MEFTSYQLVENNSSSLNTGSYLNRTECSLFVKGYSSDLWYAYSSNDVMELGLWDRDGNLLNWKTLNQSKNYNNITLSYTNTLNLSVPYSYSELNPIFIQYKNEKILVSPPEQLTSSFNVQDGSYFLTYNFTREMAGTNLNPLVIKEISPSRKELKLVPLSGSNDTYNAFCNKKVLISDISPLYIKSFGNCFYEQIYNQISPLYQDQINTVKSIFFLNTDGEMVTFLRNLYEDIFVYTTTPIRGPTFDVQNITGSAIRIQGIRTYFNNYLLSNSNKIVDFSDINNQFQIYVSASIERKFAPIGTHPSQQYVDSKIFVYDFFTKYYFTPVSEVLSSTYKEKYFGPLKNALNLGNNRLLPIISSGMMDERANPSDSITLLIKLQTELPNDIMAQTTCWVSNISLTPYIVDAILKNPIVQNLYKIGPPNFSIPIPNASLTNTNLSYTSADLEESSEAERELTVSRNINELSVDYTNFNNFVVFSSAELRLKIFKNKVINISVQSSSLQTLNDKNITYLSSSGNLYPFYNQEYSTVQGQINDIVNSFDGYESYLYRSGIYNCISGSFISSSYIDELNNSASYYDKNNLDSLVNNCPEHILTNSDNDDYIIFLSMIGHFFDNIYIYISNIPTEKRIGNSAIQEFTRRIVDYMLETFGWNLDDSLEQSNILNNYLSSEQQKGLNDLSAEDRLKIVRNRILINLLQIYKTKGTEESIRLILACYGIPSTLLSIREYGGVNYTDDIAGYTIYERSYLRQWDTSSINDTYYLQCPTGSNTFLFKVSIDNSQPYTYEKEQILFGRVNGNSNQSISGSGEWAIGFIREPRQNIGKLFFRIGYKGYESFRMYSPEFPLFDGNIYSVMLRRNLPDGGFEYTSNIDSVPTKYDLYVQRNEFGNQILRLTSSQVCYDTASTIRFGSGGRMNLIGWFSYHNGQGYTGTFDKFQIWADPIIDSNFEDYVDNINAYSYNGSSTRYGSLLFRMHTDYPFDQRQFPPSTASYMGVVASNWIGLWQNANSYYATGSSLRIGDNVDYMVNLGAWSGSQVLVYNTSSCKYVSQSAYPYQFKVVDYPSTWGISKYGPNRFRNEKVRYVSQSVEARFDNKGRSTYVSPSDTSPDSNQVGFFVDPQDFKNRDIVRYFGNFDFMNVVGDPSNQFSSSYTSLNVFRNEYKIARNQLSGSRTLFNELCILYKLYFNRSIFEAIKNVMPARTNVLTGVIIEPTILERPKYQSKEVFGEMNTGSVLYFDVPVLHYTQDISISQDAFQWYPSYFYDPNTKLLRLTASIDLGNTIISLNLSNSSIVTRDYPVNYGGNYISDVPDNFERGHFAGGIFSNEELQGLILLPSINFYTAVVSAIAPFTIHFINSCANATSFTWSFGDGSPTSNDINPSHIYDMPGKYSVTLQAYNNDPAFVSSVTKNNFISMSIPTIVSSFYQNTNIVHLSLTDPLAGNVVFTATSTITLGDPTINPSYGVLTYDWTFGDGGTGGNETIINHNYTIPGNYTVTLITRNSKYNISNTKTQTACVTVIAPEIYANFSADITNGVHPLSVTFTNSSTAGPVNYDWDFGDGTVSTDTSPVHTYSAAGVYTVTLTARSGIYSNTMTRTDYITVT